MATVYLAHDIKHFRRRPRDHRRTRREGVTRLTYSVRNTRDGLNRAARIAGIVVATSVMPAINNVALASITGSDALIAYTRFATSLPERYARLTPIAAPERPRIPPRVMTNQKTERGDAPSAR